MALLSASFWRAALRIAWRDLRSSPRRALGGILAVAAGVAAAGAVHALSAEMRSKVRGNAREWIAADLYARLTDRPSDEEMAALAPLFRQGAEDTVVTELYGMVSSDRAADPALTYIKVVDPRCYPFYGTVILRPAAPLREALGADSVVVSRNLLEDLKLKPGDELRLGKGRFRIAAVIDAEPDWSAGLSTALPRVLLSPEAFERSGVALEGHVAHKLLLRLGQTDIQTARQLLDRTFPDDTVVDFRDPDPVAAAVFEEAAIYLTVAAWLALAAGALAVALILHLHIQRRVDTAAVMKALGARSSQVLAIYGLQALGLALAGGLLGAAAAMPMEHAMAALWQRFFPVNLAAGWNWWSAAGAVCAGVLAAVPAAAGPILRMRRISPLGVLRRYTAPAMTRLPSRFALPRFLPLAVRLGARNLMRPANHSVAMVAALSGGVAILTATYLCQRQVSQQIARALPTGGANLYLVFADRGQIEAAAQWLAGQPGVEGRPQVFPLIHLRLDRIDGAAMPADSGAEPRMWLATCSDAVAGGEVLIPSANPLLHVKTGDELEFASKAHLVRGRVAARRFDYLDGFVPALTFPCAAFQGLAVFYHAAVRVNPSQESAVRRALAGRYPALPTISRTEFTNMVRQISDAAVTMMQLVCCAVLAAGVVLQILLVAAGKNLRLAEAAIVRALGAPPRLVMRVFLCEFGLLGLSAGVIGSLLGAALASLLSTVILGRATVLVDFRIALLAAASTAVVAAAAGAGASAGILRRKTMEILRQE
jgi:predicted lysophospholipase L1 biosynthesis ABC-type transport system permease subunit